VGLCKIKIAISFYLLGTNSLGGIGRGHPFSMSLLIAIATGK